MSRRSIATALITFGVLLIIGILVWLWWPYHQAAKPVNPVVQPPAYPAETASVPANVNVPIVIPPANQIQVSADERTAQENLRRQSVDFAARLGTYASADEFAGMKQVYVEVTPEVQAFLELQRLELVKSHASRGPSWGQTARSVSSRIVSALPLSTHSDAEVIVQMQLSSGAETAKPTITYKELAIHYVKSGGLWRVDRVNWQEFTP